MGRINKYILGTICILALSLQACMKDTLEDCQKGNNNPAEGGEGYISLSVSMITGQDTKDIFYGDYFEPQEHELMIDGARLVIYGDGVAVFVKDLDVTNISGGSLAPSFSGVDVNPDAETTPYLFSTTPIELIDGDGEPVLVGKSDIKLLLILNPNDDIKAATDENKPLSAFEAAVDYSDANFIGENANRFLIINGQGPAPLSKVANIHPTPEAASKFPVVQYMSRAVSQIGFSVMPQGGGGVRALATLPNYLYFYSSWYGSNYRYPVSQGGYSNFQRLLADINDIKWGVNVVNKKSYWSRRMTYRYNGYMESYMYGYMDEYTYAEDPNFEGYSIIAGGTEQMRQENFSYLDASAVNMSMTPLDDSDGSPIISYADRNLNYTYVPENTQAPGDQYLQGARPFADVVTSVVVGLKLKLYESWPARAIGGHDLIETHTFSCGFYSTSGEYIGEHVLGTRAEVNHYLATVWDIMYNPSSTEEFSEGLEYSGGRLSADDFDAISHSRQFEEAVRYLVEEYGWDGNPDNLFWDQTDWTSFQAGDFKFFNEGQMYYNVPIVHFQECGNYYYGYGVVRNNLYLVIIDTDIVGVGTVEPEIPGSEIKTAKVYVQPWYTQEISYTIGDDDDDNGTEGGGGGGGGGE